MSIDPNTVANQPDAPDASSYTPPTIWGDFIEGRAVAQNAGQTPPTSPVEAVDLVQESLKIETNQFGVSRAGNPDATIRESFDAFGPDDQAAFVSALVQRSIAPPSNPAGPPSNAGIDALGGYVAEAFEDDPAVLGAALRRAFYNGKLTGVEVAAFIDKSDDLSLPGSVPVGTVGTSAPHVLTDAVIAADNAGLSRAVGSALYDRFAAEVGNAAEGDEKLNDASSIARLAESTRDAGDASLAAKLVEGMWRNPPLADEFTGSLATKDVSEGTVGGDGLTALVETMNGLDETRGVAQDLTENVFHSILKASDDSANLRTRPDNISDWLTSTPGPNKPAEGLTEYFVNNAPRLLEEASLARLGTDDPSLASNEADDPVMIRDFISNVILNPDVPTEIKQKGMDALSDAAGMAELTATDPSLPDVDRQLAARGYGVANASVTEGVLKFVEAAEARGNPVEKVSSFAIDTVLSLVSGGVSDSIPGGAGRRTTELASKAFKQVVGQILGEVKKEGQSAAGDAVQTERRSAEDLRDDLREQLGAGGVTLFPDQTGTNSDALAIPLENSYQNGVDSVINR